MDGDIEADLVVALAGAAVGDGVGALALGDLDEELGDERPGERGRQRVRALVQGIGLQVRPDEVGHEALASIDDVGARRPGGHRPRLDALAQGTTADVDGQGHDLDPELLLEPGDGDRGIQAARIGEHDLVHETGLRDQRERSMGASWWRAGRWRGTGRASARGAPRRRTGPGGYCRPPACPPARAASTRRSPGR